MIYLFLNLYFVYRHINLNNELKNYTKFVPGQAQNYSDKLKYNLKNDTNNIDLNQINLHDRTPSLKALSNQRLVNSYYFSKK